MKNNRPTVETKVKTKVKLATKINIIIGMVCALLIGYFLFNSAFLATSATVSSSQDEEASQEIDVIAPYVKIISPQNLQEFKIGDEIEITAYADDENEVAYVKFFLNNKLQVKDDDSSDGWGLTWDTSLYQADNYLIYARAADLSENQGELSNRVFVTLK